MTARAGSAAMAGVALETTLTAGHEDGRQAADTRRAGSGSAWLALLPAAVTALVVAVGLTVPSYWRDEAATIAAVHRPLGALVRMLGNVDAVHGTYYLLVWPLAQEFGTSEVVMRLPSLLAMAIAAAVITATGRRLASPAVGVTAGLVFAVAPSVSEYGQMVRSYSVVTMAAAIASYALVRALEQDASWVRWIWYAVSVAIVGALNIFALLLVPAHAITVALRYRKARSAGRWPALRRWLAAAGTASVINVPLVILASHQRGQINWVPSPRLADVGNVVDQLGSPWMTVAIAATGLAALVATIARRRTGKEGRRTGKAGGPTSEGWGAIAALCVPWLVVPPLLLVVASLLYTPVFTQRYILFCMPAAALMTAVALVALARMPGPRLLRRLVWATAFVLVAALGIPMQVQYRQPAAHADDIREADAIMAAAALPGDALIYTWPVFMPIGAGYPYGLATLPDLQVGQAAIPSGTLAGTAVPKSVLVQRISHVRRLWVIQVGGVGKLKWLLNATDLHLAWTWQTSDMWLQLYVRAGQGTDGPRS